MPEINVVPAALETSDPSLEAIKRRLLAARMMQQQSLDPSQPVYHQQAAWAKGLQGVLGGAMEGMAERDDASQQKAASDMLAQWNSSGGQSAPQPAAMPAQSNAAPAAAPGAIPENARAIYDGLLKRGLPPVAAAGVMGNIGGESNFDPTIGGDKDANGQPTSYGLAQWRGPRFEALKSTAAAQGKDWKDRDVQLDHLVAELKGPEARAMASLQSAKTPEEASAAFMRDFERPAKWAMEQSGPKRAAYAKQFADQFGVNQQPVQVASADPNFVPGAPPEQAAPQVPERNVALAQALQPQSQPGAAPQNDRQKLYGQILANPRIPAAIKSQIMQQQTPQYGFQTLPDGTMVRTNPKTGSVETVRENVAKPTYGVVGKDEFGTEQYGFVDANKRSVTPTQLPRQTSGQQSVVPQAPPGVDPKVWREAQSKRAASEGMPASFDDTTKLRSEIQGLPSYKNLAQAAPVYRSMADAAGRDNRAADVNLIYGMAKVMDPGSVVRESEMTVAKAVATLPEQLRSTVESQLSGSGRLSQDVRQQIMQEAHSRVNSYQQMYDQDAGNFRGIAQRNRMNVDDVLPSFGKFEPWQAKPPKDGATAPAQGQTAINPKTGERLMLKDGKWVPFS